MVNAGHCPAAFCQGGRRYAASTLIAFSAFLAAALSFSEQAAAVVPVAPYVVDDRGMVIDWSRHTVRFAGRYQPTAEAPTVDLSGLDRKARFQGYRDLYQSRLGQKLLSAMSRDNLRRLVRSSNTEYFSGGDVVVNMRMNLASALSKYYANSPSVGAYSPSGRGIPMPSGQPVAVPAGKPAVIVVKGNIIPGSTFMLKDENGAIRHSVSQMAPKAFKKNLMASWYQYPAGDYAQVVAKLKAEAGGKLVEGRFRRGAIVVDSQQFNSVYSTLKPYLVNGKVHVLIPTGG